MHSFARQYMYHISYHICSRFNPKRIVWDPCGPRKTSTDDHAAIIRAQEPIHSSVQLLLNSILLCTPMSSRSYKKHWCLLNGLQCHNGLIYVSYSYTKYEQCSFSKSLKYWFRIGSDVVPCLQGKMAMQNKISIMSVLSPLCRLTTPSSGFPLIIAFKQVIYYAVGRSIWVWGLERPQKIINVSIF